MIHHILSRDFKDNQIEIIHSISISHRKVFKIIKQSSNFR